MSIRHENEQLRERLQQQHAIVRLAARQIQDLKETVASLRRELSEARVAAWDEADWDEWRAGHYDELADQKHRARMED